MDSNYLNSVVGRQVKVLRIGGARVVTGSLKSFDKQGIVVVYQVQERVPSGAPMSTGRWIEEEAFIPFNTIDRVVTS